MTAWLATEWRPSAWWLSGQACDPRSCSRTLHYPGILQLALRSGHYLVTCKLSSGDREGSGDLTSNSRGVVVSIPGYSDLWNARAHGIACEVPENGECPRNRVNSNSPIAPLLLFGQWRGWGLGSGAAFGHGQGRTRHGVNVDRSGCGLRLGRANEGFRVPALKARSGRLF